MTDKAADMTEPMTDGTAPLMTFDAVVSNPPYQVVDGGGTGDSARPVYHLFVQLAKRIRPSCLSVVIPSRWMRGGKGLAGFRAEMMADRHIRFLSDYADARPLFPGMHIDGGVCVLGWLRDGEGACHWAFHATDGHTDRSVRCLDSGLGNAVVRDSRQLSVIEKVRSLGEQTFDDLVSTRKPFGIGADLFNHPERYPEARLSPTKTADATIRIHGVRGKKGGSRRVTGFVAPAAITRNEPAVSMHKLLFSKAYSARATVPPRVIVAGPGEACTETFLMVGPCPDGEQAKSMLSYVTTKFFLVLLFFARHSLNVSRSSFSLIPAQDWSHPWTDEELYAKYGLDGGEIAFIEATVGEVGWG